MHIDSLQKDAIKIVETFFFSNLIRNFLNNLTDDNLKELDIAQEDVEKLKKQIFILGDSSESTLEEGAKDGKIDFIIYQEVKEALISDNNSSYKMLVRVENHIDINSCEELIQKFREDIKALGR